MWGNLCNSGRVPGAGRSMAKAIGVTEASFRDPLRGRVMNTTAPHAPKSNAPQLSGLQHDGHGDTDRNATIVERVSQAFQKRIGTERYGVWFGDSATISVVRLSLILAEVSPELLDTVARNGQADEDCLLVGIGSAAGHEWLRKTFRADFEAAAHEAYGRVVRVVWQTVTPLPSQATGLVPSTEPSGGASITPAKNKIGKKSPQQTAAKNIPTGIAAQPVTGTGIIGKRTGSTWQGTSIYRIFTDKTRASSTNNMFSTSFTRIETYITSSVTNITQNRIDITSFSTGQT